MAQVENITVLQGIRAEKEKNTETYAEEMLRDFFPSKSDGMIKMSERGRCASFKLISQLILSTVIKAVRNPKGNSITLNQQKTQTVK